MSVLQQICARRRAVVAEQRTRVPVSRFRESALYAAPTRSLAAALRLPGVRVIAEHKRASPSAGAYGVTRSPTQVARAYEAAGAAALSVLTEPEWFGGELDHLREVRRATGLPLLRKDFIVDPYQLHEAKGAGADAVLLIAAALTVAEAGELRTVAHHLGLEVLLELHDASELEYLEIAPDVVGVNNRNLATLAIDLRTSERLYGALPADVARITESGIATAADARRLLAAGYDGMLVGTQFMRRPDPGAALAGFLREVGATQAAAS